MSHFHPKLLVGAALCAALLAGCGGSNDDNNGGAAPPPGPVAQTITDVVAYLSALVTSDTSEPLDVSMVTLVANETAEPAPLP